MRKALYQVVFEKDHRLAHVHITSELLQSVGAKSEDTEGLIDKLQDVQTVELSVLFETLTPQTMKVSLRSKKRINVSQLASEFGGGGHPLASGIRMEGDPALNKEKVLSRIRQLMDNL
jgi:phosphoesterase RecJ-like protein